MTSGQKLAFSLLITIGLFTGFLFSMRTNLFSQLETKFYSQGKISERTNQLEKLSESCDLYIKNILNLIEENEDSYVKNPSVISYMEQNPSESAVTERRRLTEKLFYDVPSLTGMRLVEKNGRNVHYSSFDQTDLLPHAEGKKVYKKYPDIVKDTDEFDFPKISLNADNPVHRVLLDTGRNRGIIVVPFNNEFAEYAADLICYLNIAEMEKELVAKGDLSFGESFVSYADEKSMQGGFVIGVPKADSKEFENPILQKWKDRTEVIQNAVVPDKLLSVSDGTYWVLLTNSSSKYFNVSGVYKNTIFELSDEIKFILCVCIFITLFLVIYLIFSLKREPVEALRHQVKKIQYGIINEYLDNKEKIEWEIIASQLKNKKDDLSKEVLKALHVHSKKREKELEEILEKSWTEIFDIIDTKHTTAVAAPTAIHTGLSGASLAEIKHAMEEVLKTTNINVVAKAEKVPVAAKKSIVKPVVPAEELEDVEEIEDIDEVEEVSDEVEEIEEVEELDDVEEVEEIDEVEEISDVEEVEETDEVEELDDVEEVDEVEELGDVEELDDVEEVEEISDVEEVEEIDEVEELDDVEEVEEIDEVEELDDVEEVEEVDEVEELDDVEEVEEADEIEELDDVEEEAPAEVEEVSDAEEEDVAEVEEVSDAEEEDVAEVEEVGDAEEEALAEVEEVGDVEEEDVAEVEEISDVEEEAPAEVEEVGDAEEEDVAEVEEISDVEEEAPAEVEEISDVEEEAPAEVEEVSDVEEEAPAEVEELGDAEEEALAEVEEVSDVEEEDVAEVEEISDVEEEASAEVEEISDAEEEDVAEVEEISDVEEEAPAEVEEVSDAEEEASAEVEEISDVEEEDVAEVEEISDVEEEAPAEVEEISDAEEEDVAEVEEISDVEEEDVVEVEEVGDAEEEDVAEVEEVGDVEEEVPAEVDDFCNVDNLFGEDELSEVSNEVEENIDFCNVEDLFENDEEITETDDFCNVEDLFENAEEIIETDDFCNVEDLFENDEECTEAEDFCSVDNLFEVEEKIDDIEEIEEFEEVDLETLDDMETVVDLEELPEGEELDLVSAPKEDVDPLAIVKALAPITEYSESSHDTYIASEDFPTVENLFAEELTLGGEYNLKSKKSDTVINFNIYSAFDRVSEDEELSELEEPYFTMTGFASESGELEELDSAVAESIVENEGVFSIADDLEFTDVLIDPGFKALVDSVLK